MCRIGMGYIKNVLRQKYKCIDVYMYPTTEEYNSYTIAVLTSDSKYHRVDYAESYVAAMIEIVKQIKRNK